MSTLGAALAPTSESALTIDFSTGNIQVLDLTNAANNLTLTFTNTVRGGSYAIKIIQGTTARTVTWPAGLVKWPGGTPITLSTTSGAEDLVTIFFDGSHYYASGGNNYQ